MRVTPIIYLGDGVLWLHEGQHSFTRSTELLYYMTKQNTMEREWNFYPNKLPRKCTTLYMEYITSSEGEYMEYITSSEVCLEN